MIAVDIAKRGSRPARLMDFLLAEDPEVARALEANGYGLAAGLIDFLLAEDAEVARAVVVKTYGPAARIARVDTDKWRNLQRLEGEIHRRAKNLNLPKQMRQLADLYHRFESAARSLYAVCDTCGDVLDTREGRLLTPDEAHDLRRRYCLGRTCGSRARTRLHREKHPEHKIRRR